MNRILAAGKGQILGRALIIALLLAFVAYLPTRCPVTRLGRSQPGGASCERR
jgi:hypothetical protein